MHTRIRADRCWAYRFLVVDVCLAIVQSLRTPFFDCLALAKDRDLGMIGFDTDCMWQFIPGRGVRGIRCTCPHPPLCSLCFCRPCGLGFEVIARPSSASRVVFHGIASRCVAAALFQANFGSLASGAAGASCRNHGTLHTSPALGVSHGRRPAVPGMGSRPAPAMLPGVRGQHPGPAQGSRYLVSPCRRHCLLPVLEQLHACHAHLTAVPILAMVTAYHLLSASTAGVHADLTHSQPMLWCVACLAQCATGPLCLVIFANICSARAGACVTCPPF